MKMRLILMFCLGIFGCTASTDSSEVVSEETNGTEGEEEAATLPGDDLPGETDKTEGTEGPRVLTPDVLALFEVIPKRGTVEGGDSITLSGNGFQPGVIVSFDGVEAGPSERGDA